MRTNRSFAHRQRSAFGALSSARLTTPLCAALLACAGAARLNSPSMGDVVDAWYIGPATSDWSIASNWSPTGAPTNGVNSYNVFVDTNRQATTVWVNNWPTVTSLNIGGDDTVAIPNGLGLILTGPDSANNGVLSMHSVGNGTDLRIGAPVLTLGGSGTLLLANNIWNIVRNNFAEANRVVNGPQHMIRGTGQVGFNSLFLTNHGTIRADNPSSGLLLDMHEAQTSYNDGMMEATDGGTLHITASGVLNGTGGTIRARNGSTVYLESTHFYGGFLATEGTGVISTVSGGVPLLENLVNTGTVRMRNGEGMALSDVITNNGTFTMQSVGNGTDFRINTAQVVLTGTGQLAMSDNYWNLVRNNFGNVNRLVNANSHTIRGSGQLGYNSLWLTNYGLIQADQPTLLQIDLHESEANVNQGVMQATDGGTLRISYSNTISNAIGVIRAKTGSNVGIEGTRILGGLLSSEGTGYLSTFSGAAPYLDGVTLAGTFNVWNGQPAALMNTFMNNGTLAMHSVGNGTDLRINTPEVHLTGTGQIAMSNNVWNLIRNDFGDVTRLVNETTHTVRGSGQVGYNSLWLTNHGVLRGDQSSPLIIDLHEAQTNYNDGTIEAVGGGVVQIVHSGFFNNVGGTIRAQEGSTVAFDGSQIYGGTMASEGTGYLSTLTGATPYFNGVNLTGTFNMWNGQSLALMETLQNDGTLRMHSVGNGTDLRINTPQVTLTGTGELVMSNNPWNLIRNDFGNVTQFINDTAHTIRGSAQIGYDSLGVENRGTMIADQSNGLNIDPHPAFSFVNTGLVHTLAGCGATFNWGPLNQAGQVTIDAGSGVTRNGDYTQTAGATTVNGTLQVNSGSVQLLGGTLGGTGTVNGTVVNLDGTVAPGNSAGTLTVNGGYQQSVDGVMAVELGGTLPGQSDLLEVNGPVLLNGTLTVHLAPNYHPAQGTEFIVLHTNTTITGQFTAIQPCKFIATYFPTHVLLTVGTTVAEDLNCDGLVDGADLGILLGDWGPCSGCVADLNGDGIVDGADLGTLLGAWTIG